MRPLDAVLDGRFQCEQHGRSFEEQVRGNDNNHEGGTARGRRPPFQGQKKKMMIMATGQSRRCVAERALARKGHSVQSGLEAGTRPDRGCDFYQRGTRRSDEKNERQKS